MCYINPAMKPPKRFAEALSRLRREQGFRSAYSFYNGRGGRRAFGMAFANYLNLEKGSSLPKGARLRSLLSALGLSTVSPGAVDLLWAYLADVLGSETLLEGLRPAGRPDPAPASWLLAEGAARQAIGQRSVQLTLKQYEALAADGDAYACHVILANTKGGMSKKGLAAMARLDEKRVEAALARLGAAGLAKAAPSGVASPLAGKYIVPPATAPALAGIYSRLQAHRRRWSAEHGAGIEDRYLLLRASQAKFAQYLPHLADVVSLSAIYGDVTPGPDSELYLVEGRVTRLFGR